MPSWKRLVIISSSAGAGFALALTIIVGGVTWYESRPIPPKPWNTSALKAIFDHMDTEQEQSTVQPPPGYLDEQGNITTIPETIVFYYVVENETNADYKIEDGEHVTLAGHLREENSLRIEAKSPIDFSSIGGIRVQAPEIGHDKQILKVDYPVFVPAKQRVRFAIHTSIPYNISIKPDPIDLSSSLVPKSPQKFTNIRPIPKGATIDYDDLAKRYGAISSVRPELPEKNGGWQVAPVERRKFQTALAHYVSKEMGDLDGFVLFDETNRYEINFPKGW